MARRRKRLSDEDRAVWERVAKTTRPMERDRPAVVARETPDPPEPSRPREAAPGNPGIDPFRIGEAAGPKGQGHHLAPSVVERIDNAPVKMHRGTHRRMVKGKMRPDARIDLHGMTLARAHPLLIRFVLDAHARGDRLLLVITGKGRDAEDDGPIPVRRGVLRHQVPGWLTAPPLGSVVLDIRTAHRSQGGEGAYYVYLKRAK
ncbi:DNA mismatch repair protein MutS [Rhodobacterales bacterium HKCCE2091]|nr:DNA mismatch repair protein MutS [Rhodobacterales bacterium HKCCE2091]